MVTVSKFINVLLNHIERKLSLQDLLSCVLVKQIFFQLYSPCLRCHLNFKFLFFYHSVHTSKKTDAREKCNELYDGCL